MVVHIVVCGCSFVLVNFDFTYRAVESLGPPGQPSLSPHNSDPQSTHFEFRSNRFSSSFGSPGALHPPPHEVLRMPKMIQIPAGLPLFFCSPRLLLLSVWTEFVWSSSHLMYLLFSKPICGMFFCR